MTPPPVAIVLAAGDGTRFRSGTNKVLQPLLGTPMLALVLDAVRALKRDQLPLEPFQTLVG